MTDEAVRAIKKAKKIFVENYDLALGVKNVELIDINLNDELDKWLITLITQQDRKNSNFDNTRTIKVKKVSKKAKNYAEMLHELGNQLEEGKIEPRDMFLTGEHFIKGRKYEGKLKPTKTYTGNKSMTLLYYEETNYKG